MQEHQPRAERPLPRNSDEQPHPSLLHRVGSLDGSTVLRLMQMMNATSINCSVQQQPHTPSPVILGTPEDGQFPACHTHAFLIANSGCEDVVLFQAFMFNNNSRIRVRCTDVGRGKAVVYFQPVETGTYTVEVHYQYDTHAKGKGPRWPRYAQALVKSWEVRVVAADDGSSKAKPSSLCSGGPYAGRWTLLNATCHPPYCSGDLPEEPGPAWVYTPYGCFLSWRNQDEARACLQGRWILFHGDSTTEENAIGFVKDVLGGSTVMQKEGHGDSWRNFDVLVLHDGQVLPVPSNSSDWKEEAAARAATRVSMRFNPSRTHSGKPHHAWECDGLMTYTHHCNLSQELLDTFRGTHPPDAFVFNSMNWDVLCYPLATFQALMEEVAALFATLHALSPRTLIIYRTCYGGMTPYRSQKQAGVAIYERFLQVALDVVTRLPFVRIVDVYDMVQPWSSTAHTGDGIHLSVGPKPHFLHQTYVNTLLHEICIHLDGESSAPS